MNPICCERESESAPLLLSRLFGEVSCSDRSFFLFPIMRLRNETPFLLGLHQFIDRRGHISKKKKKKKKERKVGNPLLLLWTFLDRFLYPRRTMFLLVAMGMDSSRLSLIGCLAAKFQRDGFFCVREMNDMLIAKERKKKIFTLALSPLHVAVTTHLGKRVNCIRIACWIEGRRYLIFAATGQAPGRFATMASGGSYYSQSVSQSAYQTGSDIHHGRGEGLDLPTGKVWEIRRELGLADGEGAVLVVSRPVEVSALSALVGSVDDCGTASTAVSTLRPSTMMTARESRRHVQGFGG